MKTTSRILSMMTAITLALPSLAQSLSQVGESNDWKVYVDQNNAKHCYIVSIPKSSKAVRGGEVVSVNRGDIRLYIGVKNGATEPSFLAGYPLKSDVAVEVKVDGQPYNYFTNPNVNAEFAWPAPANDATLISAMKAGANVTVTGISQRGTMTVDQFSLRGFTAAYNAAVDRCK